MSHIPVLYDECIEALNIKSSGIYVDMTVGGFGHGAGICSRLSSEGLYIGLDLDAEAIQRGIEASAGYKNKFLFCQTHFREFPEVLAKNQISEADGFLMDLGVSSFQIDSGERGFSFTKDGPLDMRMDTSSAFTAADAVNELKEEELAKVLYEYGDERFARRIASRIAEERKKYRIETTFQLAEIISAAVPRKFHVPGRHPATKSFQAVRIFLNDEIISLKETAAKAAGMLKPGGRIAAVSFHSLEDRIIKQTFAELAKGCTCPKDFPVCVCGKKPLLKIITKSPVLPSEEEIRRNPRSRSAKLRAAERTEHPAEKK